VLDALSGGCGYPWTAIDGLFGGLIRAGYLSGDDHSILNQVIALEIYLKGFEL